MSTLDAHGSAGRPVADLAWLLIAMAGAVVVASTVAMLVALFRARRTDEAPERIPVDRTRWVVVWGVVIPAIILAGTFLWGTHTLAALSASRTANALTVEVIGHRWWWEIRYPGTGVVTANEIHIPTGRHVRLLVRSADVIHSVWVPQLGGKIDVVPGTVNRRWVEADQPGVYRGTCAEYCGAQHAHMGLLVVAEAPATFAAWVRQESRPAPAPRDSAAVHGERVFLASPCVTCHTIRGTPARGAVGPDLTHLASRRTLAAGAIPNTKGALGAWVVNAQGIKPGSLMPAVPLTGAELQAMLAYLEQLR
ncbi:MAG TPA: cytochrome c oxidase subunit II [Gemmatimonadaceae bacterium]|nr:cytochrome c oxidase subunit II [Gemmatimonadaceae bacterium]